MTEEHRRLGETLKSKRQEKNLSLKEVENATSIRQSYLEAIENGTAANLLAGVYAQGFLKQYATFLGFELQELMQHHPAPFQTVGEKHDFSYGIGTLEMRGSQNSGVRWLPNILWAALSAVILVLAWYLAKFLGVL